MHMARSSSHVTARVPEFWHPRGRASGPLRAVLIALALLALSFVAAPLEAQRVLRGRIIAAGSRTPMAEATVEALDSTRRVVRAARTDSAGRFDLNFGDDPGGFQLRVRRIGISPTLTDPLHFEGRDTLEVDLLVDERPAVLEEVTVEAEAVSALQAQRLQNAYARGWRVVPPKRVAQARQRSMTLDQLVRSVALANVMVTPDCFRSLLTHGCLTVFIDDVYFGQRGFNAIQTRDIDFIAVIGPAEALTVYGNRAQYGVLMLYTRRGEEGRR